MSVLTAYIPSAIQDSIHSERRTSMDISEKKISDGRNIFGRLYRIERTAERTKNINPEDITKRLSSALIAIF